jgi:NADH:ubiquinone oxidoreductase subunit E
MSTFDVAAIFEAYPPREESLIEILHDVQIEHRHLPREALLAAAEYCRVPLARVMSVATFYKAFSFEPKGETVVKICMGTACHVKGASLIKEEAERLLGCRCGHTTPDGRYTLEEVNCVGACAMAPVIIENEKYHGKFKAVDLKSLLKTGE